MGKRVCATTATTLCSASFGRRLKDENETFASFASLSWSSSSNASHGPSISVSDGTVTMCVWKRMKVIAYRIIPVLRSTHIDEKTKCESVKENDYDDDGGGGGDWSKQQQLEKEKTHENSV